REIRIRNPRLIGSGLLHDSDRDALVHPAWRSPYELPERGPLVTQLAKLAYSMQDVGGEAEGSQVVVSYDRVVEMLAATLDPLRVKQLVDAACDLRVLQYDRDRDRIQFVHQLMQEYFAARHLAAFPDARRVRMPWLKGDTHPSLEETL